GERLEWYSTRYWSQRVGSAGRAGRGRGPGYGERRRTNWAKAAAKIRISRIASAMVVPGRTAHSRGSHRARPHPGSRGRDVCAGGHEGDARAGVEPVLRSGGAAVEREREHAVGVDEEHELRRAGVRVGADPAGRARVPGAEVHLDVAPRLAAERPEVV